MEYTRLGSTGLKVSRLCLGAMTYGSKQWRPWVLSEEEARPFIRRAIELGINFFDTADMYSVGASEEVLGRALKDFGPGRDRIIIATNRNQSRPKSSTPSATIPMIVASRASTSSIRLTPVCADSGPTMWTSIRSIVSITRRRLKKRLSH